MSVFYAGATAAGGANNAAIVSGHLGGAKIENGGAVTFNFAGATITSGNTVLVGIVDYTNDTAAYTFTAGQLTKSAGTATIGTVAVDQQNAVPGGSLATAFGNALYRVPITGTGTLTLSYAPHDVSANYTMMGAAEFSGIHATPLSTTNVTTGTSATHTTGSITTSDVGVMMYVAHDLGGNNYTRTHSDTLVVKFDTAASTISGIVQYKTINSSPNTLTDTTGSESNTYFTAYALYKST